MLIINIVIDINTIRVIFYIWQRNNLLPFFYVECCGDKWRGVGSGKCMIKEQFLPPFCQVKSTVFAPLTQCALQKCYIVI